MEKIERLRSAFDEAGIDGIVLTNEHSRRYMANFTGTAGVVLISKERALFITDFRYVEQASKQAVGYEIVRHAGLILDEVAKQVKELGIQKLGFEQDTLTYSSYVTHNEAIEAEFIPTSGLVEKLRLIKTDSEIKILKENLHRLQMRL